MYNSLSNHVPNACRYIFTFSLLFIILPRLMLRRPGESWLVAFFRNYMLAVVFFIIIGYLTILLKIFEILGLLALAAFVFWFREKFVLGRWDERIHHLMAWIYDCADGQILFTSVVRRWRARKLREWKEAIRSRLGSIAAFGNTLLLVVTLFYSAYLRFYDTLQHAAPAMSDAYLVIAWMKYLDRKILFADGIYPQGFHLYLDYLHKFSALDPLYVLNYSGPFHGVLITLGLYFAVSRWLGRRAPGIIAALVYGVLGSWFGGDWMRQAAANSQEFAFIFVMPGLCFFSRYLQKEERIDLLAAFASAALLGLTHALAFLFLGLGWGTLLLAVFLSGGSEKIKRVLKTFLALTLAGLISLVPAGIGLLMGKGVFSAAQEFMTRTNGELTVPLLRTIDKAALVSLVLLFLYILLVWRKRQEMTVYWFIALFTTATFFLYYWGGVLTGSVVVSARSTVLWSLIVPVCLGTVWHIASSAFRISCRPCFELTALFLLIGYIHFYFQPLPITPYKMEYDSSAEQYLRISSTFRPSTWTIVSQEEGYALAYGKGYHLMMQDFLAWYDPGKERLVRIVNGKEEALETENVFIYHEKKVFRSLPEMTPVYERRERENKELLAWVEKYQAVHDNISVFYEDEDLKIFRIHQPADRDDTFRTIWENS